MALRHAPKKIFVSHSNRDRRFVRRLVHLLRSQNLRVWYSTHHLRGADQWIQEIGRGLASCDWFLVVLSPHAVKSMWVQREVGYALRQKRFESRIVPVLYRACKLSSLGWPLSGYQVVDFRGGFDKGCSALLEIWRMPSPTRKRRR